MGDKVLLWCVEKIAFSAKPKKTFANQKKVPGGGSFGWTP
jgi:hypothetical protein